MFTIRVRTLVGALFVLGGCSPSDADRDTQARSVSAPAGPQIGTAGTGSALAGLGGSGTQSSVGAGTAGTFGTGTVTPPTTTGLSGNGAPTTGSAGRAPVGAAGSGAGAAGSGAMPVGAAAGSSAIATAGSASVMTGSAGMKAGTAGAAAMPGKPAPQGKTDPIIPQVKGDCPNMDLSSTINFMGVSGLIIDVGPKPSSPTAPMLVYWHGTGLPNSEYTFMATELAAGITRAGGVIVSGDGTTGGDLLSGDFVWGMSDIPVMDQLVACAVKNHNVDPRKIYTAGCSAGGLMAVSYATLRASYVAAATPNSGGWVLPLAFDSTNTPALMTTHGAAGIDVVAIDFSQTSGTADTGFKQHGGFVIDCNTNGAHCGGSILSADWWTFMQAHTYGSDSWNGMMPAGFGAGLCKVQ